MTRNPAVVNSTLQDAWDGYTCVGQEIGSDDPVSKNKAIEGVSYRNQCRTDDCRLKR